MVTMRFQDKVALAAGSAAVAISPLAAEAALVTVQGAPVSLSFGVALGTTIPWDVDGAGQREFELFKPGSNSIHLGSRNSTSAPLNGRGLIAPFNTDNVQALPASFNVGPTLAAYVWGSGSASGYRYRNALSGTGGSNIGYDFNYGFVPGDNFFGFRFDDGIGVGRNYGWAVINFDLTPGSASVTIKEWTYETQDDTAVHVGTRAGVTVPEPASTLPAIALLAAGAAGVRSWRKGRQAERQAA